MSGISKIKAITERFELEKDGISIVVDSHGSKLLAIFKDGVNSLFYAEDDISHSGVPICLPSFGPLTNGKLIIDSKEFEMGQHGFIRDLDFLVEKNENSIICSTTENSETLKKYPFKFKFSATFTPSARGVSILLKMENKNSRSMPIAPGVHPYFAVANPKTLTFTTNATKGDNNLRDLQVETIEQSGVFDKKDGNKLLAKSSPDFNLIGHTLNSTKIESENMSAVEMSSDSTVFNRLTIWRKEENSKFICVEPAFAQNGINDSPITINAGESFETEIFISIV